MVENWRESIDDQTQRQERSMIARTMRDHLLLTVWLMGAWLIVLGAVDIFWPVAGWLRGMALLSVMISLAVIVITGRLRTERLAKRSQLHWAQCAERRAGLAHHPMISALQLGESAAEPFVRSIRASGSQAARQIEESPVQSASDRHGLRPRSVLIFGLEVMALLLVMLGIFCPRAVAFELTRLFDPWHDHPPFTWIDFQVEVNPDAPSVAVGDDVTLRFRAAGRPDLPLEVVAPMWQGVHLTGAALQHKLIDDHLAQDGWHRLTIHDIGKGRTILYVAAAGRSRDRSTRVLLDPKMIPRWVSAQVTVLTPVQSADAAPRSEVNDDFSALNSDTRLSDGGKPPQVVEMIQGGCIEVKVQSDLPLASLRGELVAQSTSPQWSDMDVATFMTQNLKGLGHSHPAKVLGVVEPLDLTRAGLSLPAENSGDFLWRLQMASSEGLDARLPRFIHVRIRPDHGPAITVEKPGVDLAALAGDIVRVQAVARDDAAVVSVRIEYAIDRLTRNQVSGAPSLGTGQIQSLNLYHHAEAGQSHASRVQVEHVFDLKTMGMQPGDMLRYRIIAGDERLKPAPPQETQSPWFDVLAIDQATFDKLARLRADQRQESQQQPQPRTQSVGLPPSATEGATAPAGSERNALESHNSDHAQTTQSAEPSGATPGTQPSPVSETAANAPSLLDRASQRLVQGLDDEQPISSTGTSQKDLSAIRDQHAAQVADLQSPNSGRTNPNEPRQHLDSADDAQAPIGYAPSSSRVVGTRPVSGNPGRGMDSQGAGRGSVPLRYAELVSRYFQRLAQDELEPASAAHQSDKKGSPDP